MAVPASPTPFATPLREIVKDSAAPKKLLDYLTKKTGRAFNTYGASRFDHFRITGDDLVAVTLLSMEIRAKTGSGISPAAALSLEDRASEISSLLALIPVGVQLHELNQQEMTRLLLAKDSPGLRLWDVLFDILTNADADPADKKKPNDKWVATHKLLARKRPHLFPVRDSTTVEGLNAGKDWWEPWWVALHHNPAIIEDLIKLRSTTSQAAHLSLLRIADIVTWMP